MMRQRLGVIAIVCLTLGLVACSWRAEEVVIPPSNKVSADVDSRDNALINLSLSPVTTKSSDLSGIQLQQLRNVAARNPAQSMMTRLFRHTQPSIVFSTFACKEQNYHLAVK